ncbi:riboflavin synthase [Alkalimarinus alittae]|uniref:Riboflavin synthase n=1 Tax=Alkalimarinus alittae TaxID=2961619 RepID=A0ABY6N0J4_9ALTE|nr:riboflavin synthase [Alkalimarinus alittae]UZE95622.1 riboflavin synthase [Alkalimarinus alittae]
MFTGIIEAIGRIGVIRSQGGDSRLFIETDTLDLSDVKLGDSIAVNGVCLTVTTLENNGFWADVSNETMTHTRMSGYSVGTRVNLEKALTLSTRLGGHMVSGHVDGVGEVVDRYDDGRSIRFIINAPEDLAKYIAEKGSITVDGVSLTVNSVSGAQFVLNIVPHTAAETVINEYRQGCNVHLEVDLVARYLERLLTFGDGSTSPSSDSGSKINMDFLANNGFLK